MKATIELIKKYLEDEFVSITIKDRDNEFEILSSRPDDIIVSGVILDGVIHLYDYCNPRRVDTTRKWGMRDFLSKRFNVIDCMDYCYSPYDL